MLRVGVLLAACAGAVFLTPRAAATDPEPPVIRAKVAGLVGTNGWFRSAVSLRWSLSDPTGIRSSEGCNPRTFADDTAGRTIRCTATNGAKVSRTVSVTIRIDKTPPVLGNVSVTSGDGADRLAWTSSSEADIAVIERSGRAAPQSAPDVVYRGPGGSFTDAQIENGKEYLYVVRSYDQAGNASQPVSVHALPKVLLLEKLPYLPRVSVSPILRWRPAPRATYYHVQLFRGGKRILAAWPSDPQLALRPAWAWGRHRYRLGRGTYRWYVWAGFGPRSSSQYKRLGTAAFVVRAP